MSDYHVLFRTRNVASSDVRSAALLIWFAYLAPTASQPVHISERTFAELQPIFAEATAPEILQSKPVQVVVAVEDHKVLEEKSEAAAASVATDYKPKRLLPEPLPPLKPSPKVVLHPLSLL